MTGLAVRVDLEGAVREAAAAFEALGADRFPRAVQFALTGVAIDGVNRWRRSIDQVYAHTTKATREGVRYTVDKDLLGKVASVGEAKADVFVLPLQSVWMKYGFGDGTNLRLPGDVGIEAFFGDQQSIRIPVASNIAHTGLGSPGPNGRVRAQDARNIARLAAAGYQRNTAGATRGSGTWGALEIKPGAASARQGSYFMGPGLYARPPRIVAAVGRTRIARAIRASKRSAPTTEFTRRDGTEVTVPKVVNADVPRMLFMSTPDAHYKPNASPSWERDMNAAAATMADRLARELTDRLERAARKGRRTR